MIAFKQLLKESLLGNYEYDIPNIRKDPIQLVYDFYMTTSFSKTTDDKRSDKFYRNADELNYEIDRVKEKLYGFLKEHLLAEVFDAIATEMRYIHPSNSAIRDYISEFPDRGVSDFAHNLADFFSQALPRDPNRSQAIEVAHSMIEAGDCTDAEFVRMATEIFDLVRWNREYGGEAWSRICNAWTNLNKARTVDDMMIWIDHIFDLQHNSGSVLNKSAIWGSHISELQDVLNEKAAFKNPENMISHISKSLLPLATLYFKITADKTGVLQSVRSGEKLADEFNEIVHFLGDSRGTEEDAAPYVDRLAEIIESPDLNLEFIKPDFIIGRLINIPAPDEQIADLIIKFLKKTPAKKVLSANVPKYRLLKVILAGDYETFLELCNLLPAYTFSFIFGDNSDDFDIFRKYYEVKLLGTEEKMGKFYPVDFDKKIIYILNSLLKSERKPDYYDQSPAYMAFASLKNPEDIVKVLRECYFHLPMHATTFRAIMANKDNHETYLKFLRSLDKSEEFSFSENIRMILKSQDNERTPIIDLLVNDEVIYDRALKIGLDLKAEDLDF